MLTPATEKKLLQAAVGLACLVPLSAGLSGVTLGASLMGGGPADLDSHFRYLSGLLLGIAFGFLSAIPMIERKSKRFRMLTFIVVVGGLARLLGLLRAGYPGLPMTLALGMELGVTPLLCLWQHRVARRFGLDFAPDNH